MGFGFLGSTEQNFSVPDVTMSKAVISFYRQHLFEFNDGLSGALRLHLDNAEPKAGYRMVRCERQDFGQSCLGGGKSCWPVFCKSNAPTV